jgi:hypothetical protein
VNNSGRKANQALLIFLLILLLAGVFLIFQLEKADFMPSLSLEENPQLAYPPPEVTRGSIVKPSNIPTLTTTLTSTPIVLENGWYLYEDKEAGFSFSYPPDVFFHTSQEGDREFRTAHIQFTMLKGQGYQGMVVDVLSNPTNQSIDKIIQEKYSTPILNLSLETINATVKKISVAEIPAYLTTYQPFMFELCIFVPYGDKILFIVPVHDNLDFAGSPEALKVFWNIVKTFKIYP